MALLSSSRRRLLIAACSVGLLPTRGLAAQQRTVATTDQLDRALAEAEPGDEIVLADGEYSAPKPITRGGTIEKPIVIRAANILGAIITSGEVRINADNVIVHGLDSTSNFSIGIDSRAANFRLWRCRIRDNGSSASIAIRLYDAPDFEGAYCQVGPSWQGRGFLFSPGRGALRPAWRYSMFRDPPSNWTSSGDGEAMHFSDSGPEWVANGLIHRCKFKNWNVGDEPELISIKCSGNRLIQCSAENCNSAFVIRFGHSNTFEGCWTKGSWGFGARDGWDLGEGKQNKILGCIVENLTNSDRGIYSSQGDWLPPNNRPSGGHFPVTRNLVISGCTGTINAGRTLSGLNINPRNVRIRQHSGPINLGVNENPDSQPGVAETLYEWSSPIWLEDADVGPFADF